MKKVFIALTLLLASQAFATYEDCMIKYNDERLCTFMRGSSIQIASYQQDYCVAKYIQYMSQEEAEQVCELEAQEILEEDLFDMIGEKVMLCTEWDRFGRCIEHNQELPEMK